MNLEPGAIDKTVAALRERLLDSRLPNGCWQGRLSSSALSTAAAVFALHVVGRPEYEVLVRKGLDWLIEHQNADGGWGDTPASSSNISTTMLCWAALGVAMPGNRSERAIARVESWLVDSAGGLEPDVLIGALDKKYGPDRSFSVPILTMCALADVLGEPGEAWQRIRPLPFELAALPHRLFKWLRLPVVSYALPALIAIGQSIFEHKRPGNPVVRVVRGLSRNRTLTVLEQIQPANGGFLEATPLTAFVVMNLAAAGRREHAAVNRGVDFLVKSVREDGSWPIDTNLATWVTTLSASALAAGGDLERVLAPDERAAIRQMLLDSQYRREHPYTHAAPGGWAWTALPGAVPDADDTAGALIALARLGPADERVIAAAAAGIEWLLALQNRDGGIPTFCRGWTNLPFDRSAPDLTAHALAAFGAWFELMGPPLRQRVSRSVQRALGYLRAVQRDDGAWVPLWFGNEDAPRQENPVYGTARVLCGVQGLAAEFTAESVPMVARAVRWLLQAQDADGGWGGDRSVRPSVEETALATDALAGALLQWGPQIAAGAAQALPVEDVRRAVLAGASWLIDRLRDAEHLRPAPIGLYFAKLWYFEEMYPVIFALSALQKVRRLCNARVV